MLDDQTLETLRGRVSLAASQGDVASLLEVAARLGADPGPAARALRLAAWMEVRLWTPEAAPAVDCAEVEALSGADLAARASLEIACRAGERASLLAFDGESYGRWLRAHEVVASARGADALEGARGWWKLMRGEDVAGLVEGCQKLLAAAAAAKDRLLVADLAVLRAFAADFAGQRELAAEVGRRAFRICQAEGLPQGEYLASLALVRVRRASGRPYQAVRVASALARAAPAPWRPWVTWDLTLAGGDAGALGPIDAAARETRAGRAVSGLQRLLAAARSGDIAAFERETRLLTEAVASHALARADAVVALAALDIASPAAGPVASWIAGDEALPPAGVHGMVAGSTAGGVTEAPLALVLARPGARGQRFLAAALSLVRARVGPLPPLAPRRSTRVDSGLAALALAGPDGLEIGRFFSLVYGFGFRKSIHKGVLEVLLHRMRAQIEGIARLERGEKTLALRVERPFVIPDGRCVETLADRILRTLADRGPLGAEEAARAMRVSRRTVHWALQSLISDGTCRPERRGRHVVYQLEDTTFTQTALVDLGRRDP